jgi:hypothetical protein
MKAMALLAQCPTINASSLGLILIMYNDGMMSRATKKDVSMAPFYRCSCWPTMYIGKDLQEFYSFSRQTTRIVNPSGR